MDCFFLIVNFDCYVLKVDTRIDLCIICNIVIYLLRLVRIRDLRNAIIDRRIGGKFTDIDNFLQS